MSEPRPDASNDVPGGSGPRSSGDGPWTVREEWTDSPLPVHDRTVGEVTFEMHPVPAARGEPLCGVFRTNLPAENIPEDGFYVRLCRYERVLVRRRSGGGEPEDTATRTRPRLLLKWSTGTHMEALPSEDGETMNVPVFFETVPPHQPCSTPEKSEERTLWRVEVRSEMAGIDYAPPTRWVPDDWSAAVEIPVFDRPPQETVPVASYARHEKQYEPDHPTSDAVECRRRADGELEITVDSLDVQKNIAASCGTMGLGAVALFFVGTWIYSPMSIWVGVLAVVLVAWTILAALDSARTMPSRIVVGPEGTDVRRGDVVDGEPESGGFIPHSDLAGTHVTPATSGGGSLNTEQEKKVRMVATAGTLCDLELAATGEGHEERTLAARCPDALEAAWLGRQIERAASRHRDGERS